MCGRYFIDLEGRAIEMTKIIKTLTKKVGSEKIKNIQTSGDVFRLISFLFLLRTKLCLCNGDLFKMMEKCLSMLELKRLA